MNIQEIQKWIKNAKPNESIIYYTGHMVEERDKAEIREMANAFMLAAQQGEIDLFQNKIKEGDQSHKPIYEYIAKKLKNEREKSNNIR
tara:strand:- start:367 stop:630 length:264 start_codon:yes stop_codon:yes gene_type:complete